MSNVFVRRDTQAWSMQIWASFLAAFSLCSFAVWSLPGEGLERVLVAVGMFFVLSATFTLSKMLRDNQSEKVDTAAWVIQVWSAFVISISLTGWAMFRMSVDMWHKWFLVAACLFLLSAAFSLAKTLRDRHEADVIESNVPDNFTNATTA